jgi:hypothetical protein
MKISLICHPLPLGTPQATAFCRTTEFLAWRKAFDTLVLEKLQGSGVVRATICEKFHKLLDKASSLRHNVAEPGDNATQ